MVNFETTFPERDKNVREIEIVAKALDGQRYPLPLHVCVCECEGERGSGPKGADDLCLVSLEALSRDFSFNSWIFVKK